jgi:hypothetical protein
MKARRDGIILLILLGILWNPAISSSIAIQLSDTTTISDTTQNVSEWFLLDPETDHYQGVSVEKTYHNLLKDRPSKTVLVAVIDSGIDIDHEDLKDVIWTNPGEVANNGVDDDKNGYVDDIHGWNFIGGKNGNVDHDT